MSWMGIPARYRMFIAKKARKAPVLERFTEKSIEALNRAQEEAKKLGLPVVGTDQILVGIIQADNGLAGKVLGDVHGKIKQAQREVEKIISAGAAPTAQPEIPLTPGAKKVLERAWDEARAAGKQEVGTEHLLLAIAMEGGDAAMQPLKAFGVDTDMKTVKNKLSGLIKTVKSTAAEVTKPRE